MKRISEKVNNVKKTWKDVKAIQDGGSCTRGLSRYWSGAALSPGVWG